MRFNAVVGTHFGMRVWGGAVLVLCALSMGCALKPASPSTRGSLADGESHSDAPVTPIRVIGHLDEADVRSISAVIATLAEAPILRIEVIDPVTVEVRTVQGPMASGGRIYDLKKEQNGKWVQINLNQIRGWAS